MSYRLTILTVALAVMTACATVPYTGRRQLMLGSESREAQQGAALFSEILAEETVISTGHNAVQIREVGRRIAAVAGRPEFDWEFVLIAGDDVNAFALPGGKTAVYAGIVPVAHTTAGLAVVMGHEIGHAIARHGAERSSQGLLAGVGAVAVDVVMGGGAAGNAVRQAYGLGTTVGVLLPFSRHHESEADVIGLMLMARAGYDPSEAIGFWERMDAAGGSGPAEFLSTHPSGTTRRETISKHLAQALEYYEGTRSAPIVALE